MRMSLLAVGLSALLAACSSSSSSPPSTTGDTGTAGDTATGGDTGGGDDTGSSDDTGTTDDTGGGGDTTPSKPATPTITSIAKMGGALHVFWKLNDTGLSNVELWRNKDGGTYAKVYTLPGTATSQHDTGAVAPGTYCFQVYTIKGGVKSDPSPEKCGTP